MLRTHIHERWSLSDVEDFGVCVQMRPVSARTFVSERISPADREEGARFFCPKSLD